MTHLLPVRPTSVGRTDLTSQGAPRSVPLGETTTFPERLAEAVKPVRYTVEPQSPSSFVCKPKHFLVRLLSLELNYLHVVLRDGSVALTGPAVIVNRVRKKLLGGSTAKSQ
jgi:hypothetical protein